MSSTPPSSVELPYGPSAVQPPAQPPALPPVTRPVTRTASWVAFGAAVALPIFSVLPGLVSRVADYETYRLLLIVGTILEAGAYLAVFASLVVVALTSRRSPGVRVATIVLAAIGTMMGFASAGTLNSDVRLAFLLPLLMFVTWALAAGFRGKGFLAIFLVIVWSIIDLVVYTAGQAGPIPFLVAAILGAGVTVGVVFAARAWERAQAVEIAASGPATLPAPVDPATHTNGFAIAALILGVASGSVLAIVFGHVALSQIRRIGGQGRGIAIAGLVLGYFWLAVIVAGVVIAATYRLR